MDAIITNKVLGIIIFILVMWGVFWVSQTFLGPMIAEWLVGWIENFQGFVPEVSLAIKFYLSIFRKMVTFSNEIPSI